MADAPAPPDLDHPTAAPTGTSDPLSQVEQQVVLGGEPDEVWALLTDPAHVERWLGRPIDLDLAGDRDDRDGDGGGAGGGAGDEGQLIDVDGTARHVRVLEREPGRRLRWHWWPEGDEGAVTTVEITLVPRSPGTEVRVVERRAHAAPTATACTRVLRASRWRATTFVEIELALLAARSPVVLARS